MQGRRNPKGKIQPLLLRLFANCWRVEKKTAILSSSSVASATPTIRPIASYPAHRFASPFTCSDTSALRAIIRRIDDHREWASTRIPSANDELDRRVRKLIGTCRRMPTSSLQRYESCGALENPPSSRSSATSTTNVNSRIEKCDSRAGRGRALSVRSSSSTRSPPRPRPVDVAAARSDMETIKSTVELYMMRHKLKIPTLRMLCAADENGQPGSRTSSEARLPRCLASIGWLLLSATGGLLRCSPPRRSNGCVPPPTASGDSTSTARRARRRGLSRLRVRSLPPGRRPTG